MKTLSDVSPEELGRFLIYKVDLLSALAEYYSYKAIPEVYLERHKAIKSYAKTIIRKRVDVHEDLSSFDFSLVEKVAMELRQKNEPTVMAEITHLYKRVSEIYLQFFLRQLPAQDLLPGEAVIITDSIEQVLKNTRDVLDIDTPYLKTWKYNYIPLEYRVSHHLKNPEYCGPTAFKEVLSLLKLVGAVRPNGQGIVAKPYTLSAWVYFIRFTLKEKKWLKKRPTNDQTIKILRETFHIDASLDLAKSVSSGRLPAKRIFD